MKRNILKYNNFRSILPFIFLNFLQNVTKSLLGGLKAVSWDFSPGNQYKIKRDAFFYLNELNIEHLRTNTKPENIKPIKLEECMVNKLYI